VNGALFAGQPAKERLIEGFPAGMAPVPCGYRGCQVDASKVGKLRPNAMWIEAKGWNLELDVGQLEGETTLITT
jgi:hypothetical protein